MVLKVLSLKIHNNLIHLELPANSVLEPVHFRRQLSKQKVKLWSRLDNLVHIHILIQSLLQIHPRNNILPIQFPDKRYLIPVHLFELEIGETEKSLDELF